jgi:hypothetical protein
MGVGATARAICKKTLRPQVLAKARLKVDERLSASSVFDDDDLSAASAIRVRRLLRPELGLLSKLLIPDGELKTTPPNTLAR